MPKVLETLAYKRRVGAILQSALLWSTHANLNHNILDVSFKEKMRLEHGKNLREFLQTQDSFFLTFFRTILKDGHQEDQISVTGHFNCISRQALNFWEESCRGPSVSYHLNKFTSLQSKILAIALFCEQWSSYVHMKKNYRYVNALIILSG